MSEPHGEGPAPLDRRVLALLIIAAGALVPLLFFSALKSPVTAQSTQTSATRQTPDQSLIGRDCRQCHKLVVQTFLLDNHGKSASFLNDSRAAKCEQCHRNSEKHAETSSRTKAGEKADSPANPTTAETNETCLFCHARDRGHFEWRGTQHDRSDMSCLSCHNVHHTKFIQRMSLNLTEKTDLEVAEILNTRLPEHMLLAPTVEDTCFGCHLDRRKSFYQRSTHLFRTEFNNMKVGCSSCHNPHGGPGAKMLVEQTVNNVCYKCHAEKRGPFLWDHPPVRENCLNCHSPHGSNNAKLLTARVHMVCQQCHIHMLPRHSTTAGKPLDIFSINRGCLNCHGQVHGSNHPGGRTLTR